MRKTWTIIIFLLVGSSTTWAKGFNFNYKNLNVLSALICEQVRQEVDNSTILFSKFSIDKTKLSSNSNDVKFEVTGTCNARYSKTSKDTTSYGQELQLEFNLKDLNKVSGTIGINPIEIVFSNRKISKFIIKKIYENKVEIINLKSVRWAKSNSLFILDKKDLIKVKLNGRIVASEKDSNLILNNGDIVYNFWSYDSFMCHSHSKISQERCETISSQI